MNKTPQTAPNRLALIIMLMSPLAAPAAHADTVACEAPTGLRAYPDVATLPANGGIAVVPGSAGCLNLDLNTRVRARPQHGEPIALRFHTLDEKSAATWISFAENLKVGGTYELQTPDALLDECFLKFFDIKPGVSACYDDIRHRPDGWQTRLRFTATAPASSYPVPDIGEHAVPTKCQVKHDTVRCCLGKDPVIAATIDASAAFAVWREAAPAALAAVSVTGVGYENSAATLLTNRDPSGVLYVAADPGHAELAITLAPIGLSGTLEPPLTVATLGFNMPATLRAGAADGDIVAAAPCVGAVNAAKDLTGGNNGRAQPDDAAAGCAALNRIPLAGSAAGPAIILLIMCGLRRRGRGCTLGKYLTPPRATADQG